MRPGWKSASIAGAIAVAALGGAIAGRSAENPAAALAESRTMPAPAEARAGLPDVDTMVDRLAKRLRSAPGDAEGWRMLGWSYNALGRHAEAVAAYEKAIGIDGGVARYHSGYGEALVRAAGGAVTPAAASEFRRAAELDRGDIRARFFLALAQRQQGDLSGAYRAWTAILRDAPADAPGLQDVRVELASVALQLGRAGPLLFSRTPAGDGAAPKRADGPN